MCCHKSCRKVSPFSLVTWSMRARAWSNKRITSRWPFRAAKCTAVSLIHCLSLSALASNKSLTTPESGCFARKKGDTGNWHVVQQSGLTWTLISPLHSTLNTHQLDPQRPHGSCMSCMAFARRHMQSGFLCIFDGFLWVHRSLQQLLHHLLVAFPSRQVQGSLLIWSQNWSEEAQNVEKVKILRTPSRPTNVSVSGARPGCSC